MSIDFTASTVFTRTIVNAAVRLGADKDVLLEQVGIAPEILGEPESRVLSAVHIPLLEAAVAMTGNDHVGLRAGEWISPDPANVIYYLFLNSPTLGEGLDLAERYYPILSDTAILKVDPAESIVHLILGSISPVPSFSRQINEWTIATWITMLRKYAGSGFNPVEVRFSNPAPEDLSELKNSFRAPLEFEHPSSEIIVRLEDLRIPNPTGGDPHLLFILEQHAQRRLQQLMGMDSFLVALREDLLNRLTGKSVDLADVSKALAMSGRVLQRRLKSFGTSYREVLEISRKEIAITYLRDSRLGLKEIGSWLGFSTPGSFYRAFNRWFGTTPAEFRKKLEIDASEV